MIDGNMAGTYTGEYACTLVSYVFVWPRAVESGTRLNIIGTCD